MVKKNDDAATTPNTPTTWDDEDKFQDQSFSGELIYARPEAGATYRGELLGRFKKPGDKQLGTGYCYRIRLTYPAMVSKGKEDNIETFLGPVGTVVMMDERKAFEVLETHSQKVAELGARIEVLVRFLSKTKTGNGQTFWQTEIKTRYLRDDEDFPHGF